MEPSKEINPPTSGSKLIGGGHPDSAYKDHSPSSLGGGDLITEFPVEEFSFAKTAVESNQRERPQ